jgi:anti-anti-sigma factor
LNTLLEETVDFRAYLDFNRRGACVVVLMGEADSHAAPELEQRLAECCASPAVSQVVVDLTRASFLDSIALSVLVGGHRSLKKVGLPLKVVCIDRNIRRVLGITGLDRLFPVYDSAAAAVRDCAPPASQPAV